MIYRCMTGSRNLFVIIVLFYLFNGALWPRLVRDGYVFFERVSINEPFTTKLNTLKRAISQQARQVNLA